MLMLFVLQGLTINQYSRAAASSADDWHMLVPMTRLFNSFV